MQFTGNQLVLKRNVYTQTGNYSMWINCAVDNTTGQYYFGLSGNGNSLDFMMQSGKLYFANTLIHSYLPYKSLLITADFTNTFANISKDGVPLAYGLPKQTGYFDYFYFKRDSASSNAAFNLYVSGDNLPNCNFQNIGYLLSTGQAAVTGTVMNLSQFPINIFDSNISTTEAYTFGKIAQKISSGASGIFAYSGDFTSIDTTKPIVTNFNTNFGNMNISFSIVDLTHVSRYILLNQPSDFTMQDGIFAYNLGYSNYSGGNLTNNFQAGLQFILKNIIGSGFYTDPTFTPLAQFSTPGSGYIFNGYGLISGTAIISTGNGSVGGLYTMNVTQPRFATGTFSTFFSGFGTGMASGVGYTGAAYGAMTGIYFGTILANSGSIIISGNVTGYGINGRSVYYPAYSNATGYVNLSGMMRGDVFYINSTSDPLVKGLQFNNETGLAFYLNNTLIHDVTASYNGAYVALTARDFGSIGNGLQISAQTCNNGNFAYSPFLTGGFNSGTTGNAVYPIGPYLGFQNFLITGSGYYFGTITGYSVGVFTYTRTFSGSWDLLTGLDVSSMVSIKSGNSFNANTISGSGLFAPNGSVYFQIQHYSDGINIDQAQLIITGNEVVNGLSQIILSSL